MQWLQQFLNQYRHEITSDVDFMVSPSLYAKLPTHIASIAKTSGARLVQYLQHEATAGYFVLARLRGSKIEYLHLNASDDYCRNGHLWLHAEKLLANRRRHDDYFWVASPDDSFRYYLIKKIDKKSISAAQAKEFSQRYGEDYRICRERLYAALPAADVQMLEHVLSGQQPFDGIGWQKVNTHLSHLRHALHKNASKIAWRKQLSNRIDNIRLKWQRLNLSPPFSKKVPQLCKS